MRNAIANALRNSHLTPGDVKNVYLSKADAKFASENGRLMPNTGYVVSALTPDNVPQAEISYFGFIIVKEDANLSGTFNVLIWGNAIKV
ncbi:hypothetical protein ACFSOZ_23790 [Mesorhizobium newzealandense]|uniref:Uncharacterized protein n=1 Tax=Mesorhizobium newzealandense TaxID=1300302 RepID=A0ABW4UG93_9HYPH